MTAGEARGTRGAGETGPSGRSGRGAVARFRALYGESPAHLLVLLGSLAVCGYAAVRLLSVDWFDVAKWVVGAALVHDLVLLPLYAGADWLLHKALRTGALRTPRPEPARAVGDGFDGRLAALHHIRVPALVSLLLLLVYWPLITADPVHYQAATALSPGVFAGRWLAVTAALFAASGLLFAVRLRRARRRTGPDRGPSSRRTGTRRADRPRRYVRRGGDASLRTCDAHGGGRPGGGERS